jgi:hypothetical protein
LTFVTTILALIWLAVPGIQLSLKSVRRFEDHVAAATGSIVAMALFAALVSVIICRITGHTVPSWLPLATTLPVIARLHILGRHRAPAPIEFEWHALIATTCAVLMGIYAFRLGYAPQPDGSLDVHAWYNADWFKHLGHAHAVANLGLPARDIFGGGGPLHYYWLFYVIPGAASGINGDAAGSLYWVNHTVGALFWILLYGIVRRAGASPWQSALLLVAGITLFSVQPTIHWLQSGLSIFQYPSQHEPAGPVLISMGLYIPQHTLMLSVLLAWILIVRLADSSPPRFLYGLTLSSLAAAGAISTLFGAFCLIVYGLTQLGACNRDNWRRIFLELACVGVAAIGIIFALQILDPGMGEHAIASPLFENQVIDLSFGQRLMITTAAAVIALGPVTLLGIAFLGRWQQAEGAETKALLAIAWTLLAVGLAGTILPEAVMDNLRVAKELRIRSPYLAAVAVLIGIGWACAQVKAGKFRPALIYGLLGVCLILAVPGGFMRIIWHGTDGPAFFTKVPGQDMGAMAFLAKAADRQATVWQYPEAPELATRSGDDTWVPILAGRTISASLRATDYPNIAAELASMERFFGGKPEPIPNNVDWLYLSRRLHPATFDPLVKQMRNDRRWKVAYCPTDACLFQRARK